MATERSGVGGKSLLALVKMPKGKLLTFCSGTKKKEGSEDNLL